MSENDVVVEETVVEPVAVAEETTPPADDTVKSEDDKNQPEVKPERTFTQKELDDILQKRLAKESRKVERYARAEAELRLIKEQMQPKQRYVEPSEPKPDQFNDYESYIASLTDWKVDQKLRGLQEQTMQQRQLDEQTVQKSKMRENLIKSADKYDDFEDVVTNPALTITAAMRDAIGESEIAGDVAYHLGMNTQEAERIAALSPIGQVKAIMALEAKLKAPEKKLTTDAPEPITPNASKGQVKKDPFKMTDAEYAKWRKTGKV